MLTSRKIVNSLCLSNHRKKIGRSNHRKSFTHCSNIKKGKNDDNVNFVWDLHTQQQLAALKEFVGEAKNIVVISGAGLSTESKF